MKPKNIDHSLHVFIQGNLDVQSIHMFCYRDESYLTADILNKILMYCDGNIFIFQFQCVIIK